MAISTESVLASRILASLHEAGHTAYLVGGCVRDLLLDHPAKDFDIATSAAPDELLRLFPKADRVGAHFGVVLVKEAGAAVEVATFRRDHAYLDGRRPEAVTFETDPRQDALRRDFTINAMMMDPRSGAVLDFAGGRADLAAKLVRAVGDPLARFAEDHLRLLRAVRFAARLGFAIEGKTLAAIRALAPRIRSISAERVREELMRILTEGGARRGVELLAETGLLDEILPEVAPHRSLLEMLEGMSATASGALALAILLHQAPRPAGIMKRLRFSHEMTARVCSLVENQSRFAEAGAMSVATLKRFLRLEGFEDHLELHRLRRAATGAPLDAHDFVRAALAAFSFEDLHPPKLATGEDLIALGLEPGPAFARLLEALETAQLEGRVSTRDEALAFLMNAR